MTAATTNTSGDDRDHEPRLLAIDDSELIHRLLTSTLHDEGVEVHAASTGEQGVAMAASLMPDVILLDIEMPGMDGFEVLRTLKATPETHDIPVVLVSGGASTDRRVRGLEMGAIDFIAKPFDLLELKARVRAASRLGRMVKMLAQRARIDGLTGLWNRRYLDDRLTQEIVTVRRHDAPLSLIFCDIDHFKAINDRYGHPFADRVLAEFSRLVSHARAGDVTARYGGEEFVIILPRTSAERAAKLADRLRRAMRCRRWNGREDLIVTASFGVSDLERATQPTAVALLESADRALCAAKQSGRDRVEIAPRPGEFRERSA